MSAWRTTPTSLCAGSDGAGLAGACAMCVPKSSPLVPVPPVSPSAPRCVPTQCWAPPGRGKGPNRHHGRCCHSNNDAAMAAAGPLLPAEVEALVQALRGTELRDAGRQGCGGVPGGEGGCEFGVSLVWGSLGAS